MLRLLFVLAVLGLLGFGLYQVGVFALFVTGATSWGWVGAFMTHLFYVGLGGGLAFVLVWLFIIRPKMAP